jgi:hypothetical protein
VYHDRVLYLWDEGRDLQVDDVVVGRPAPERGGEVVLADVDEVERVPEPVGIDRSAPTCTQGGQRACQLCCVPPKVEAGRHVVFLPYHGPRARRIAA